MDLPICNLDLEQCRNGHRRWKAKKALVQQFYTLVYLDPYLLQRGNCSRNLGTCLDFVYYLLSCIRFFFFYWKFMCSLVLFLSILCRALLCSLYNCLIDFKNSRTKKYSKF